MTQQIIRNPKPNPIRPKMALGFDTVDREHLPHHLRRYDVEASRLHVGMTFSPQGKWVELRIEEYYTKAGASRGQAKEISTTYKEETLLALCDFFEEVKRQLAAPDPEPQAEDR